MAYGTNSKVTTTFPALRWMKPIASRLESGGRKHLCYIKEYRPALYTDLLTSGKVSSYLAEVDNRAKEMLNLLVNQMAEKQGITEQLKVQGQITWVQRMNNIRNAAEEIILQELIYEEDAV